MQRLVFVSSTINILKSRMIGFLRLKIQTKRGSSRRESYKGINL